MQLLLIIFSGVANRIDREQSDTVCICHFVRNFGVLNFRTFTITFSVTPGFNVILKTNKKCSAISIYSGSSMNGHLSATASVYIHHLSDFTIGILNKLFITATSLQWSLLCLPKVICCREVAL